MFYDSAFARDIFRTYFFQVNERTSDPDLDFVLSDLRNTGSQRKDLEHRSMSLLESRICNVGHKYCTKKDDFNVL